MKRNLSSIDCRRIALEALVDERTLGRALAGRKVRDMSMERIVRALATHGLRLTDVVRESGAP